MTIEVSAPHGKSRFLRDHGGNTPHMFKRRYAVLGFMTWMLGKRLARRKLRSLGRSQKHVLPFA